MVDGGWWMVGGGKRPCNTSLFVCDYKILCSNHWVLINVFQNHVLLKHHIGGSLKIMSLSLSSGSLLVSFAICGCLFDMC